MKNKYRTLIISCWCVLIACFLIKIFGGNFFEMFCSNEKFIQACKFIDNGILKYILSFITYLISTYIFMLAILKNDIDKKRKLILILALTIWWFIKLFIYNQQVLAMSLEMIFMICLPIILNKKYWKMSLISLPLNLLFQIISALTKNLGIKFVDTSVLSGLIFSIDYYIMVILFYLYRRKEN